MFFCENFRFKLSDKQKKYSKIKDSRIQIIYFTQNINHSDFIQFKIANIYKPGGEILNGNLENVCKNFLFFIIAR